MSSLLPRGSAAGLRGRFTRSCYFGNRSHDARGIQVFCCNAGRALLSRIQLFARRALFQARTFCRNSDTSTSTFPCPCSNLRTLGHELARPIFYRLHHYPSDSSKRSSFFRAFEWIDAVQAGLLGSALQATVIVCNPLTGGLSRVCAILW